MNVTIPSEGDSSNPLVRATLSAGHVVEEEAAEAVRIAADTDIQQAKKENSSQLNSKAV